tara:strand:- start:50962 stop:51177 length:216 start_codon:yes stop_codon:yes gene_type:complete
MSWYAESYGWIREQQLGNPELSRLELRKHCSKNYPFRERSGYAYKAFLKAMNDVFGATRRKKQTNQGELFD